MKTSAGTSIPGHADIMLGLYRELMSLDMTAGKQDEAEALLKRAMHYTMVLRPDRASWKRAPMHPW